MITPMVKWSNHYIMLKNKINEILAKFNVNLSVENTIKLAAIAKTIEGIEVGTPADEFAEGVEVYITIEGEVIPAPNGDHTLEDGTIVSVQDGKITKITAKVEEEEMSSEITEVVSQLAERISVLEATNASQAAELSALKATNEVLTTKLSATETKAKTAETKVTELSKKAAETSVTELSKKSTKTTAQPAPKSFSQMTYIERVIAQMSPSNQN